MGNPLLLSLYNLEPNNLINIAHKYDASLIVITALIDDIPREIILQHSDEIDIIISKNEEVVRNISSGNDPQTTTACAFCFKTEYSLDDPRAKSLFSAIYKCALGRYHQNRIKLQSRYNGIQKSNAALRIQKYYRTQLRNIVD